MKQIFIPLLVLVCLIGCATAQRTADEAIDADGVVSQYEEESSEMIEIAGQWKGDLVVGSRKIPFVFHLELDADGDYSASLDSPSEGVYRIPVKSVSIDGREVVFALPVTSAEYVATLDDTGEVLSGTWKQRGASIDLVVERQSDVAETRRPQEPVPPFPYNSVDAVFRNEEAGIILRGTVTFPDGPGPFPGVVLITGSGQQNRDEEIFGHKPFLVLADALTRAGIAVLRYDDRGAGESEGVESLADATSEDFAGDAMSAFQFLRELVGIDRDRIGLIGHSEGGMIAPGLAAISPEVAFVVLLAAPGFPGAELTAMQSVAILEASAVAESMIKVLDEANRRIYRTVLDNPDNDVAAEKVTEIMKGLGMNQAQIDAQLAGLLSPWYRYYLAYDPIPALESLDVPVLALTGTLDLQVPHEPNLEAIKTALAAAPTTLYRVEALDGLNHLFQTAETGLVEEYGQIDETFAPSALDIVVDWVVEVTT